MTAPESKSVMTPATLDETGLDRTRINSTGQVELTANPPSSDGVQVKSENENEIGNGGGFIEHQGKEPSKLKRLLRKTEKVVHIHHHSKVEATAPVLADARDTVSDSRLMTPPPTPDHHGVHDLIHNPVSTVQSKVTGQGGHQIAANLVAKEISHGTEVELVKAYEKAEHEKAAGRKAGGEGAQEVQKLVKDRQDMFVRWTMDRHVNTIRILPVNTIPKLSKTHFQIKQPDGSVKTDWEGWAHHQAAYHAEKYGARYIGYGSNPPTPSKESLMPSIERLLVASAPLQTLIMSIRRVYRWDDRNETLKYLVIYLVLWCFNIVLPGCLAALVWFTFQRRLSAPSIDDMRGDIKRVEDMEQTAMTLSEFIEKRGEETWVDPLIEDVGPWMMVQLSDLANLMETIRNFYEWRVPRQTAVTLGLLVVSLIAVSLTPTWLIVRASSLSFGFAFFGLFPISSRFPEYRLLASPAKWLLWNIPTHAEWAVLNLQAEGQRHHQISVSSAEKPVVVLDNDNNEMPPPPPAKDYGSYDCSHNKLPGKLILNASGVRFVTSIGHKEIFTLTYPQIHKMVKVMRIASKSTGKNSGEDLKLIGPGNVEYLLKSMKERDQAFTQIVGFSPVRWQVVW